MDYLCDYHIHSRYSPEPVCTATLREIVEKAVSVGLRRFGVSDHLHTKINLPAVESGRIEFDEVAADFDQRHPGIEFYFGVEVSCLRQWDLRQNDALGEDGSICGIQDGGPEDAPLAIYLPPDVKERLKCEYVIGGVHWPLGAPAEQWSVIRSYHRQYMFLADHPDVDIVAHPWWWMGYWEDDNGNYPGLPWLRDFSVIPDSLHREFAEAVAKNGKAVEINASAVLLNGRYPQAFKDSYLVYLEKLLKWGVKFSLGSDSHSLDAIGVTLRVIEGLKQIGITPEVLWDPSGSSQCATD